MKRLVHRRPLVLMTLGLIVVIFLSAGCKTGEKSKDDHMPAGGHAEELADSTRLDAAEVDTMRDANKRPVDSTNQAADTSGRY